MLYSITTNNEVNIEKLYLSSLKGFVRNLETEDLTLTDTPLDTTVSELPIGSLRESVQHFERAYRYLARYGS